MSVMLLSSGAGSVQFDDSRTAPNPAVRGFPDSDSIPSFLPAEESARNLQVMPRRPSS